MEKKEPYKIQIRIVTPEIINMDEILKFQIFLKNLDSIQFPGGEIKIIIAWPEFPQPSPILEYTFNVSPLESEQEFLRDHSIKPLSYGYTIFRIKEDSFKAVDGNEYYLYNFNGHRLLKLDVIHSFSVRSLEEVYSKQLAESSERLVESNKLLLDSSHKIEDSSHRIEILTYALIFATYIFMFISIVDTYIKTLFEDFLTSYSIIIMLTSILSFSIIILSSLVLTFITIILIRKLT